MCAISTWLSPAGPGFVGKWQIYRRWWTFLRGYFIQNGSRLLKWPRTIEVSFWKWNMESQNTHSGITSATIWVHFPHIQNHCQVPGKRCLFLLLFSTVNSPCYSFCPKLAEATEIAGERSHSYKPMLFEKLHTEARDHQNFFQTT